MGNGTYTICIPSEQYLCPNVGKDFEEEAINIIFEKVWRTSHISPKEAEITRKQQIISKGNGLWHNEMSATEKLTKISYVEDHSYNKRCI